MRIPKLHSWDLSIPEAKALQQRLAAKVSLATPKGFAPALIAGADMSHRRGSPWLYGAVAVVRFPGFEIVETRTARRKAVFPYVPGYLSFREGPVLMDCFEQLHVRPDAVLFDGQGYAHPRRFGLACHLGLWLNLPSIGCAKSRLCGDYEDPGPEPGSHSALCHDGERIGTVVRSRLGSRPHFVSVGLKISLTEAERLTRACGAGYRLPEPTRMAHLLVNAFRRSSESR